jgi:CheY-like chemotaxis protein
MNVGNCPTTMTFLAGLNRTSDYSLRPIYRNTLRPLFSPVEFVLSHSMTSHLPSTTMGSRDRVSKHMDAYLQSSPRQDLLRILCVDDDTASGNSLAELLSLLGCDARICRSGLLALDEFRLFNPGACFVDINLTDSLALPSQLRPMAGGRPLFLVAVTTPNLSQEQQRQVAESYQFNLVKPVGGATLARLLNEILEVLNDDWRR